MNSEKNILIVGTSHISQQSIDEIHKYFEEFNPDIIAVELDILRFQSLISKKQKRNLMKEINIRRIQILQKMVSIKSPK